MPGALLGPFGRYELGIEPVTIGRSSSNTLVITDSQVSGRHLQVLPQGAGYLLVDVGSSNGTFVNGVRLPPQTPQPLRHGDVIMIGATRLTVELVESVFPAAPQPAAPGQAAFAPSEQIGFAPVPPDQGAAPTYGTPVSPMPDYGPPAQPGAPFQSAAPPNPFGPYPGTPPAQEQGYPPGVFGPGATAGTYQGAPGVGVGGLPPRTGRRRLWLLIGSALVALLILGGSALAVFLLTRPQAPTIPDATTQVVTPFYDNLKKQDYTTATGATTLFTPDYLQQLGGKDQAKKLFQQFDQIRGVVTNYHVVSVKSMNGSATSEVATVEVTRDPSKGTFQPDTLQLIYQKGKWQISRWTPGQRQSQG